MAVGAGLGDERYAAATGEAIGKGSVEVIEGGDVPQAIGSKEVDAVVQTLLSDALLKFFLSDLCKPGCDDGDVFCLVNDAGVNDRLRETGGHEDDNEIHRLRQLINRRITRLAVHFLAVQLRIHTVEFAFILSRQNVVKDDGAELGRVIRYAHYRDAFRTKE